LWPIDAFVGVGAFRRGQPERGHCQPQYARQGIAYAPAGIALTTTLTINFLGAGQRAAPSVADAQRLKLGRRLATAELRLSQEVVGLVAQGHYRLRAAGGLML